MEKTIILIIFSVFILAMVIVGVLVVVWPQIRYGPFSPCWGKFVSGVGSISLFTSKENTIIVGDCVESLFFINQEHLTQYAAFRSIACPSDAKGFIVGIPRFPETESNLNPLKVPQDIWENIVKWWKEKVGGIEPICKGVEKPFSGVKTGSSTEPIPFPIEGLPSGSLPFCVKLEGTDSFTVVLKEGACVE